MVKRILGSRVLPRDAVSPAAGAEPRSGHGSPAPLGTAAPRLGSHGQSPAPCPVSPKPTLRYRQHLSPSGVAHLTGELCRNLLSGVFPSCSTFYVYFDE